MSECIVCKRNEMPDLPPRESVFLGPHWRVAHAYDAALLGWMILICRRHVTCLADLTVEEARSLGLLLPAVGRALERRPGTRKAYVVLFAEREGFEHLHLHVVPRAVDLAPRHRGVGVFDLLGVPPTAAVPEPDQDTLARALRPEIAAEVERLAGSDA